MKITRYKKACKRMSFFTKNFGFHAPYNLLIDGTFCNEALQHKVKISEQLPKYLQVELKIVTTQCCIIELENLTKISRALQGAWLILKQFPTHRCGHEGKPITSSACIKSMLGDDNPHRYIVASADHQLRGSIRERWVAVPLLYMHHAAPTLEKPTEDTQKKVTTLANRLISDVELDKLNAMKSALGIVKKKKQSEKKSRKRLTGAEIKRRKKAKEVRLAQLVREQERQRQEDLSKLKAEQQSTPPRSKGQKKQADVDIYKRISAVLGV